jgi:hypothetical protein
MDKNISEKHGKLIISEQGKQQWQHRQEVDGEVRIRKGTIKKSRRKHCFTLNLITSDSSAPIDRTKRAFSLKQQKSNCFTLLNVVEKRQ